MIDTSMKENIDVRYTEGLEKKKRQEEQVNKEQVLKDHKSICSSARKKRREGE
jgi:hypothetical protein